MRSLEVKVYRNYRNEIVAETTILKDGKNYEIRTSKHGKNLVSVMTEVKVKDSQDCTISEISFDQIIAAKKLIIKTIRATIKSVTEQQTEALKLALN